MSSQATFTVYFDGACPLCRREIAWYRRRPGADTMAWVDVSRKANATRLPDLTREAALTRFHVRLPDGRLLSGAPAFGELWKRLPGFRLLGKSARMPFVEPLLERLYRGFLRVRPVVQKFVAARCACGGDKYPRWLERELRSNHAGETGAVAIYRGILAVSRDASLRRFATDHLETEARHLALMERLLSPARRSRLSPVWRAAGFATGVLPALFGPRAVYITIEAVESFVDSHYRAQIAALAPHPRWHSLRALLDQCRSDETAHRDEARRAAGARRGPAARIWAALVGLGSSAGVIVARRI